MRKVRRSSGPLEAHPTLCASLLILLTLAGCDALPFGDDPPNDLGVDATHVGPLSPTPACPIGDATTLEEAAADTQRVAACLGVEIGDAGCATRDIWLNVDKIEEREDSWTVGFELLECHTTTTPREGPAVESTLRYRGSDRTLPPRPYRWAGRGDSLGDGFRPCFITNVVEAIDPADATGNMARTLSCMGDPYDDASPHCWGPITRIDRRLLPGTQQFYCRVDFHHFERSHWILQHHAPD